MTVHSAHPHETLGAKALTTYYKPIIVGHSCFTIGSYYQL